MGIDGNAWTQSNYFYFKIDDPTAVTSPCERVIWWKFEIKARESQ